MNSSEKARRWTEFLAAREEIASGERLLQHFNAGTISRICDCGCNSYDIKVPIDSGLKPLLPPKERGGCAFSMAFNLSNRPGSIEFDVFVDAGGYLAGVDVSCNANSEPVPDEALFIEPPYHAHGALMALIDHRHALDNLVRFEGPILELEKPWQRLPYDYDGVPVMLTMTHIKHALRRRIDGEVTAKDLELWADLVEGRPGIEYEDEEQCSDLLFQLSTPEINQPLSADVCQRILAALES